MPSEILEHLFEASISEFEPSNNFAAIATVSEDNSRLSFKLMTDDRVFEILRIMNRAKPMEQNILNAQFGSTNYSKVHSFMKFFMTDKIVGIRNNQPPNFHVGAANTTENTKRAADIEAILLVVFKSSNHIIHIDQS